MSLVNSRQAYSDCYDIFEAAMKDPEGVRVPVKDHNAATFLRMRLHQARKINRQDNTDLYNEGDPLYAASVYDKLVVRLKEIDRRWYVYVEHGGVDIEAIEPLSEIPQVEYHEIHRIESKAPLMIESAGIKRRV